MEREKVKIKKIKFKKQTIELPFEIEVTKPFTSNEGTLVEIIVELIKGFSKKENK